MSWEVISPDLSREKWDVPENVGIYRAADMATMPRRGVIYTVAPSFKDINTIWVGTDDGLIHITRDGGKNWTNITPPDLKSWAKVSLMEASHFDNDTAYAAINTFRLDNLRPHIYRTHDGGKTWKHITKGIPDGGIVNAVREDPVRKGLLYAGTEQAVYVSFDDGENWQSLRLNMPATSIRDLVVHNDDIVVGTHGRSFWILDDVTPLRQINSQVAASDAHLFNPQVAYRLRRSVNTDTPIPQEEPMGENPPDGAIINYYLKADASEVALEILDKSNRVVRRFSSLDKPEPINPDQLAYPTYWFRPPQILSNRAGMQRFVWDLHFAPPEGFPRSYPISAIYRNTPTVPMGPAVLPGEYTVKLTVNGRSYTASLTVKIDPRVTTSPDGIAKMFEVSFGSYEGIRRIRAAQSEIANLRAQLKTTKDRAGQSAIAGDIDAIDKKAAAISGGPGGGRRGGQADAGGEPTLSRLAAELNTIMGIAEGADAQPTTQTVTAYNESRRLLDEIISRWNEIKSKDVSELNEKLRRANLPLLKL
jgi:hypothetical protein